MIIDYTVWKPGRMCVNIFPPHVSTVLYTPITAPWTGIAAQTDAAIRRAAISSSLTFRQLQAYRSSRNGG